jgi:polyribonucleotide nucleotidyltransferase
LRRCNEAVAKACREIEAWAKEVGRPKKMDKLILSPEGVEEAVEAAVGPELAAAMAIGRDLHLIVIA